VVSVRVLINWAVSRSALPRPDAPLQEVATASSSPIWRTLRFLFL